MSAKPDRDAKAQGATGSVTSPGLVWRDEFALGHLSMDTMHREFVDRVHGLLTAEEGVLETALDDFEAHAQRHFAEEDDEMRASRYDAAGCHVDEHAAVLASLREVRSALARGRPDVVRAFGRELARWFPEHVQVMDQALVQWLMQRRLGGSPIAFRRRMADGPERPVDRRRGT